MSVDDEPDLPPAGENLWLDHAEQEAELDAIEYDPAGDAAEEAVIARLDQLFSSMILPDRIDEVAPDELGLLFPGLNGAVDPIDLLDSDDDDF